MFKNLLLLLKTRVALQKSNNVSVEINEEDKSLTMQMIVFSQGVFVPYRVRDLVEDNKDLHIDEKNSSVILTQKIPLYCKNKSFRHYYNDFSKKSKNIIMQLFE